MQTLTQAFADLEIARAWPVFVTCSGEVEIHYSSDEWLIGDVTINCFRQGELAETVTYTDKDKKRDRLRHRRLELIRSRILQDSHLCALIDEAIEIEIASRREIAEEARYDERREAAA